MKDFIKNGKQGDCIVVQKPDDICVIHCKQLLYVVAEGKYSRLYTVDGKSVLSNLCLMYLEKQLDESFFRCNRKNIINLRYVTKVVTNNVVLDGKEFLVSRRRKKEFRKRYIDYQVNNYKC
ncbi:MAG: hypothetical protein E7281_04830 [Lachnospiraceae bacterium]|nr:hypothetical protein [Lachnospiraceae bacterium]